MKFLIGIFLLPLFSFGQTTYNGHITDSRTKKAIPFASVALLKENIGINANEDGSFILVSKQNIKLDSLIISCVGYETKKLPLTEKNDYSIELKERIIQLETVNLISQNNWDVKKLNVPLDCGNVGMTTDGSHTQVAKYFISPSYGAILTEIEICNKRYFNSRKAVFRIRIYDMDTVTTAPSTDLCNEVIEVRLNKKHIVVNLEKYKIHIPSKNFFVAVEWLKIPENENKFKSTDSNGIEREILTYRPSIGGQLRDPSLPYKPKIPYEVWQLNYQNRWIPLTPFSNFSITATIKY